MPMATETMTTSEPPQLAVKGIKGSIPESHLGRLRPTPKDTPVQEMRRRLDEDGYLFLKNLIPRADVLNVRKHYFQAYTSTGMLHPDTTPEEGIFNPRASASDHLGIGAGRLPNTDAKIQQLVDSHHEPTYVQFLHHPALRQQIRELMGWDKDVLLKRTLLRHNNPGSLSTGVHYDKIFLRSGGAYCLTAWIPLGDISLHGGGLMYLSTGKELGKEIEADFDRRSALFPESERINAYNVNMAEHGFLSNDAGAFLAEQGRGEGKWLVSEFEAGDVVFHDPYMVHGSTSNQDEKGRIRLSTDLRFAEEGSAFDQRWMQAWRPGDGL